MNDVLIRLNRVMNVCGLLPWIHRYSWFVRTWDFPLLCGMLLILGLRHVQAAPPELMTYQGFLVDANGEALATNAPANYPVIFRVFSTAGGGDPLWAEQQIVTVDRGNFSVMLGEGTPVSGQPRPALSTLFAGPNSADRYMSLSVTIGSTTSEMLPRLRLLPAPYAFQASSASSLVNAAGAKVLSAGVAGLEVVGGMSASGGLTLGGALSATALDISGVTTVNSPFSIRPQGGNEGAEIVMQGTGASNPEWRFDTAGNQIRFHSGGISRFSVDTAGNALVGGNLGIGVAAPTARLHVGGPMKIEGINTLEFGAGVAGKQADAGRVGYQVFSGDALDVVGAGTSGLNRKVKFWAEGGSDFSGSVNVNGAVRARGGGPGASGSLNNGFAFTGNGGDNDGGMFSSADGQLEFYGNAQERIRITTSGLVGIGTTTPGGRLEVNGDVRVVGSNPLEFGAGVGGKEASAGKIGYGTFTPGALDIVGAGTTFANRRVKVWAEGGAEFTGNVGVRTATPLDAVHVRGGALRIDDGAPNRWFRMYRVPEGLVFEGNSLRNPNNQPSPGLGRAIWDGDGNLDSFSDRRLKKDIVDAESVLARIMRLQVRRFHWTNQLADDPKVFGVIAQEVEPLFPELVRHVTDLDGSDEKLMTVKQGAFGLIAAKAVQELKAEKDTEVTSLQREVRELKEEVASLKSQLSRTARVESLQQELDELKQAVRQMAGNERQTPPPDGPGFGEVIAAR
ncbi:MAG: tail fiber domain-containing protein [Verrucomicrobiales bacterium]|nr:tail fiber domain-containing protein [Verrucomicrobiales bacterium]